MKWRCVPRLGKLRLQESIDYKQLDDLVSIRYIRIEPELKTGSQVKLPEEANDTRQWGQINAQRINETNQSKQLNRFFPTNLPKDTITKVQKRPWKSMKKPLFHTPQYLDDTEQKTRPNVISLLHVSAIKLDNESLNIQYAFLIVLFKS